MTNRPRTTSSAKVSTEFGRKVWSPDANHGFVIGRITDIASDGVKVQLIGIGKNDKTKTIKCRYDDVFPAEDDERKDFDDNCSLMYLNEATLLNNTRLRYLRNQIYTYVANILISINPYQQIVNLYSSDTIRQYQGKSLGVLPPHIFAIADKAYRDMKRLKESQSIIVSGESGAGKTESQKYILRFLCESYGAQSGPIEKKILETNPILEAFGNARTLRNNNSSRFGKFVEIHFNNKHQVAGGFVSHYLLEKSRLCHQQKGERNYHIFYQLIAGSDEQLRSAFNLTTPDAYNYLKYGCSKYFCNPKLPERIDKSRCSKEMLSSGGALRDELLDDFDDFQQLTKALSDIGLTDAEKMAVFQTVAAVLHLGNIQFNDDVDDTKGGCMIDASTESSLKLAGKLLGVEANELRLGLITRIMQPTKGGNMGTIIRVPLKPHEASHARDALTKCVYSRLFDEIVIRINRCIPFASSHAYIGVLDIAGFEFFTLNSFEQFCINYCNEKLQQFFNDRILKQEQELYEKEGLCVKKIEFIDNEDCIDLIELKGIGLIDLLDEEAKLPRPTTDHYTATVHNNYKNHFRLTVPRKSKLKEHREMRDDEGFIIRHYAGAVCYQTSQFIDKNNDALHTSLQFLLEDSRNDFIKSLFTTASSESNGGSSNGHKSHKKTGKLSFISVGDKFRTQLNLLLEKLQNTGAHFVRCIKPNSDMRPSQFEGIQILSQLKCAGMTSVLRLMQQGYPSRTLFADLYQMYRQILPSELARLDPRLFCKCLFHALGLNDTDFKFGLTKVFFRPGKFAEFDQLLRQDPDNMRMLVAKVKSWLHCVRWKKAQYGVLSVLKLKNKIKWRAQQLIIIQSALRGCLARRKYRPRYKALMKINALLIQMDEMRKIVAKLNDAHKPKWQSEIASVRNAIDTLIGSLKKNDNSIRMDDIEKSYHILLKKTEDNLSLLKKQSAADEQEKIRQVEQQMLIEKQRIADEERIQKELELAKIERHKIEEQRRIDEAIYADKANEIAEEQRQLNIVDAERCKKEEQDRLDLELAKRLVQEDSAQIVVETSPTSITARQQTTKKNLISDKYNFSEWQYADLRDIINTSIDIEQLQACRAEFHRRLKIYNEWKAKNQQTKQRAPTTLTNNVTKPVTPTSTTTSRASSGVARIQRYFRVPFSRPADRHRITTNGSSTGESATATKSGYWYAHFDGQYIVRQMEIHPNKRPILMIAGRDDMDMCEMSLDQTGLIRKKGAEILAHQFEHEWYRHGGPNYLIDAGHARL